jgi:hypothetical protein
MKFTYHKHTDFPEYITCRVVKGTVGVKDLIESWSEMEEKGLLDPPTVGLLNLLDEADIKMKLTDFRELLSFLRLRVNAKRIKIAAVSHSPNIVAFPFIANQLESVLNIKPFATKNAAVSWILEGVDVD